MKKMVRTDTSNRGSYGGRWVITIIAAALIGLAACAGEAEDVSAAEPESEDAEEPQEEDEEPTEDASLDTDEGDAEAADTVEVVDGLVVEVDESLTGELTSSHGIGVLYAPVVVARQVGILEAKYPNLDVDWFETFTTDTARDAMLAGQLSTDTCTVVPFLTARDAGLDWVVVQNVSGGGGGLVVPEDGPDSALEFLDNPDWRMSPGPNTAQWLSVAWELYEAGEDPLALDDAWVRIPHPDAIAALESDQLEGHFATVDFFLDYQERDGFKTILNWDNVYGGPYPVHVCALREWVEENPELARAYADTLQEVVNWMDEYPDKAAEALSDFEEGATDAETFQGYLESDAFTTMLTDANIGGVAESMAAIGMIESAPEDAGEVYAYPDEAGADW